MFGIETIRAMNAEAAEKARDDGLEPTRVESSDDLRDIKHLGDACADIDANHERVDTLFVDTSGFGSPGEPALTQGQFFAKVDALVKEHGPLLVALEEVGQFQGYVAIWEAG